jgi:hypothetical protein
LPEGEREDFREWKSDKVVSMDRSDKYQRRREEEREREGE